MEHPHENRTLFKIALVAIGLLVLSSCVNVMLALKPGGAAETCNSLGAYPAILDSFHAGNKALDGNKDGTPCNSHKPK